METPALAGGEVPGAGVPAKRRRLRLILSALLLVLLLMVADLASIALDGLDLAQPVVTTGSTDGLVAVGDAFRVSSTVTAMPACSVPATLAPGVDRCLVYSVHNPGPLPIIVMTISVASVDAPASCPVESLDAERATYTGELSVPAGATVAAPGVPLALRSDAAFRDGCQGAEFFLEFTATARYGAATP